MVSSTKTISMGLCCMGGFSLRLQMKTSVGFGGILQRMSEDITLFMHGFALFIGFAGPEIDRRVANRAIDL